MFEPITDFIVVLLFLMSAACFNWWTDCQARDIQERRQSDVSGFDFSYRTCRLLSLAALFYGSIGAVMYERWVSFSFVVLVFFALLCWASNLSTKICLNRFVSFSLQHKD